MSESPPEFDPSYVAGLLDAAGRVRFNVTRQGDDSFTVRPQVRIYPHANEFRTAAIGTFLDDQSYQYRFAQRNDTPPYFILHQRSDLRDLHEYLADRSATLVRELEFVMTTFADEFDFEILSPKEAYRLLLTRDALRYDWRPRGPRFLTADSLAKEFGFTSRDVEIPELPIGPLRTEGDSEWGTGFIDGNGRVRPSIAEDPSTSVGYSIYPKVRMTVSGRHPATVKHLSDYLEHNGVEFNDVSQENHRRITVAGVDPVCKLLDTIGPRLLALGPFVEDLLNDIIPRFRGDEHKSKDGFYRLLQDMTEISEATYGRYNPRKYDLEFFYERWKDDPDFNIAS